MHHLALAAALATSRPDLRVIRAGDPHVRYLRVRLDITLAGVRGTETSLYDLATGRWRDRIAAGPLSGGDGFDGRTSWSSDATGMPLVEGNAAARLDARAIAHFFGRQGPERPRVQTLPAPAGRLKLRLRYPPLAGPIDVTLDRAGGRVTSYEDDTDLEPGAVRFADYRRVAGVVLPLRTDTTDRYGAVHERVRAVEVLAAVPPAAFAPPPPPDDVRLAGTTSVAMRAERLVPVVPIRIDGGPVLHVLFDTGGSNALAPAVARRLGLELVGHDASGGVGAGLVGERYATVRRLQIGRAVLRDQPFAVLDAEAFGPQVDGTIGCEVLQRFAVRFDFARRRVDLTRRLDRFGIAAPPIPMRTAGCTPEIDGALDGIRGPVAIDTGSGGVFDVMSPAVRAHRLVARYHARGPLPTGRGIGGTTYGYLAFAASLRLGRVVLRDVPVVLDTMSAGAFDDPSELGNAGVLAFRRFVTVFDYRSGRMWLLR